MNMTTAWTAYLRICLFDFFDVRRESDQRAVTRILCALYLSNGQTRLMVWHTWYLHYGDYTYICQVFCCIIKTKKNLKLPNNTLIK